MTGGSAATDPLQPHPRARRFRPGGLALACAALLALAPRPAMAHATVLSSSPSPGERLQTAPGVVVLAFSEALNARLSRAIVIGPGSATFEQESVSESEVRITLTTNAPGVYEVRWTSVSAVDGHTLSGGYRFGVGVTPAPAGTPEEALPAGSDLALAAARAFEYAGLILAVGLLLLLRLARRGPRLPRRRAWIPAAIGISTAAGLAVVSGDWLIAAGTASPASLAAYLDSPIGWVPAARVAAEAVALLLALRWPEAASLPLAAALVALAATGHAAAVGRPFGGVAVAAVHLAAGGLWAGGILALALRRPPGGWPGPAGGRLLARFTPVALAAAALTAATGLLQAAGELGTFGDLVTSAYGRVLTAKALAVLVMIPLSFLAWRRRALLSRTLRVEAGLALTALAASGLLAAFPFPPARLQEAAAAAAGPSAALARPAPGDLTLAAAAGDTLVGLTLRPGQPGRNTAWLWLLPIMGDQAAARLQVTVFDGGRGQPARRCGPACRVADLTLSGGETLRVGVAGAGGGTATLVVPTLPASDAAGLVARAEARMHDLVTYRVDETLRPATEPLAVTYAYQVPDRLSFQVQRGGETVIVGGARYWRASAGAAWQRSPVPPVAVPSFAWDAAEIVAPRALGTSVEDGRALNGAAFFEDPGAAPVWFELWMDDQGLVRRAEMRALGHFMEDRYRDFDARFSIEPPAT